MKSIINPIQNLGYKFKILYFQSLQKGLPLLIFILQACNQAPAKKEESNTGSAIPVRLLSMDLSHGRSELVASGKFTTEDETMLSFKLGGIISRIFVKEGDPIHKGQLLSTIKTDEIDAQVNQAKLALAKSERDYSRHLRLFKDSVITQEQLENFKTQRDLNLEQLKSLEFNLQYSKIVSPVNGFVLKKLASEGQQLSPGTPVLQINGAGNSAWVLQIGVSDDWWAKIKTGDTARISTDAEANTFFKGRVIRKSHGVDMAGGVNEVDIQLLQKPAHIGSGMYGKAYLSLGDEQGAFRIPYEAVLDASGNQAYVYTTQDNKTAHRVKVQIQSFDENSVLIKKGLENGGKVIVAGSAYLSDGSPIQIIQ